MENIAIEIVDVSHWKWWCSIAMWNYQRVYGKQLQNMENPNFLAKNWHKLTINDNFLYIAMFNCQRVGFRPMFTILWMSLQSLSVLTWSGACTRCDQDILCTRFDGGKTIARKFMTWLINLYVYIYIYVYSYIYT